MPNDYFISKNNLSTQKLTSLYAHNNPNCFCKPVIEKKNIYSANYSNLSKKMRNSNTINNSLGGKITYGNFAYGGNANINYLGRMEGQNGGSGAPIRNKF